MTLFESAMAALIGLTAGILGGLAGIGGSMIMLPGLALLLGYHDPQHSEQHVYMAAAMCVNVLVSIPAAWRHARAGVVRTDLVKIILPAMAVAIIVGVLLSNRFDGWFLMLLLAVFISAYSFVNLWRLVRRRPPNTGDDERSSSPRLVGIGAAAGLIGGLLGLGGGVVMVPMLQVFARVPLRQCIGTSSSIMWLTAIIGAVMKLATLGQVGHAADEALWLVLAMGPAAVLGGMLGATLVHKLPLNVVRGAVAVLLLIAAIRIALPTTARLADLF